MLSIQAVRGLPRLRAPGIVPCIARCTKARCDGDISLLVKKQQMTNASVEKKKKKKKQNTPKHRSYAEVNKLLQKNEISIGD